MSNNSIEREIRFTVKEAGYLSFIRLFVYEFMRVSGFILGKKGTFLPAGIRRRIMEPIAGGGITNF